MKRIIPAPLIKQIVYLVDLTTRQIVYEFHKGSLQREDQITGALVSTLDNTLSGIRIKDIEIKAKAFSLKEEMETKADLGVLLNVKLPEYKLAKAFIAQAKICKRDSAFRFSDGNIKKNLLDQCSKMIEITSSSFVIVYTRNYNCGIRVFPAADVYALDNKISCKSLTHLYSMTLKKLFENFLKCFIGDLNIAPYIWDVKGLKKFLSERRIKHGLLVQLLGEERR